MKKVLRVCLYSLVAIVAVGAVLFGSLVYTPAPAKPHLSGTLNTGTIDVGGLRRTYRTDVPRGRATGAPLVVVMHSAGETGAQLRMDTA